MDLQLVGGDITTERVDAIVNAANSALAGGGGVDGAIHRAAGPILDRECAALRRTAKYRAGLPTGQAVATSGGALHARWVIHTVGPIYREAGSSEGDQRALLRACYRNSLAIADELRASSIAFPLISAGAYRWPRRDAITQAIDALLGADSRLLTARLVLFDNDSLELAKDLLEAVNHPR